MVKEDQRGEGLVNWHAEDFAKAGEARRRNAFKEVGIVQLIAVAHTPQNTVIHHDGGRLAFASDKGLPVAQRRLFKVGLLHQEQPIAKLQIAEEVHHAVLNLRHRADEILLTHFHAEGQPFQALAQLRLFAFQMVGQRLGKGLLLPLAVKDRSYRAGNRVGVSNQPTLIQRGEVLALEGREGFAFCHAAENNHRLAL